MASLSCKARAVLIDSLPVLQPQPFRDLATRRRKAALGAELLNKLQHFQLPRTEVGKPWKALTLVPYECMVWSL